MIKRHYEIITSIECDCCLNEEFIVDNDDIEITEISIAWNQAENMGWKYLPEKEIDYHFCPNCVIKLFKEPEHENRNQQN